MVIFLEKDKDIIKIYSHDGGNTVIFEERSGARSQTHINYFQERYTRLLSEGYVNVTNKYFIYLVKAPGTYCIIEDIDLNGSRFSVTNSVGASFTCGPEGAKRAYNEKIQEGYVDVTHAYDEYEKAHDYGHHSSKPKGDTYMYGLDRVIDPIPLPDFYKRIIFGHFRK